MIRPTNGIEDLFFSTTKNCEMLIKQTHTKPQGSLKFKHTKPRKTISFKPPISVEGFWMVGLLSLVVFNSIFNITEENNNFELFTDKFD